MNAPLPSSIERLTAALADRYRLERELGQGGMATVYLAEDVKHHRKVAIKVLRPELAAVIGADRFLVEIRTTANLQHPHILPLHDSGNADGLLFYVMPYIEGVSLRDRLSREHQLPIAEAVRIASEVADALEYAHQRGIIHRDIKPENILLQGGHALVADFGIALAVATAAGQRMTETGLSLGTPQYMSPEQAIGERALDARSDIYALGAVTYEMLAGDPPFSGSSMQAIVAKVLTEKPSPISTVRDTVPSHIEAAVRTALAKLPADRFASAAKFTEALQQEGRAARPETRDTRRRLSTPVAGIAMVAALAAIGGWWLGHLARAPEARWSAFTQLTDASGVETSPSLSPDGESFAYASNARGTWDIFVQRVGGRNPVLVAGDSTRDEVWPAYSPDGKQIAYNQQGDGIFVMGATGESPRRLTTFGANPAWSPDGRRIVFGSEEVTSPYRTSNSGTLWTVDVSGGVPRQLDSLGAGDAYQPAWSPSGSRIAFWTSPKGQRDLQTISAAGGARIDVTNDVAVDWAPVWSPDGKYLYFASDRGGAMGIWRIPVDEASGGPTGSPEPVVSGVDVAMDLPRLSKDGTSLVFRAKIESVNPAAIAFDPVTGKAGSVTLLQHRTGILTPTDVSPDGKWIALFNSPDRQQDIFIMHPDGSGLTRLTDDDARDWFPRFTPDNEAVTFFSNAGGKYDGWSIRLDGSGRTRLTDFANGALFSMFAPDGKRLVVNPIPRGASIGSAPWPVTETTGTPIEHLDIGGGSLQPRYWSRDGRWLTGGIVLPSGEFRGNGLFELATGRVRQLSTDGRGYDLAWLPGFQRVVYFIKSGALMMQDITTLERHEVMAALPHPPDQFGGIAASPDGRTIYYGAQQIEANVWLVTRAAPHGGKP